MMLKKALSMVLTVCICFCLVSCGKKEDSSNGEKTVSPIRQLNSPAEGDTVVTIVTDKGTIKAVIYDDLVPNTAQNFIALAESGYYDGMVIHKVIKDFVMQFGDKTLKGDGGDSFSGKGVTPEYRDDLHSYKGSLGMVVYGDGLQYSQFFIVAGGAVSDEYVAAMQKAGYSQDVIDTFVKLGGQPGFDYVYTVFGQVFEGMDIVEQITSQETDKYNRPKKDITVSTVTISTYSEQ